MPVVEGPWRVKCKSPTKNTGERCKRWAVKGTDTCAMHGGGYSDSETTARKSAEERLAELRERFIRMGDGAADTVERIAQGGHVVVLPDGSEVPVSYEAKDQLSAAKVILDRVLPAVIASEEPSHAHRDLDDEIESVLEAVRHMNDQADTA